MDFDSDWHHQCAPSMVQYACVLPAGTCVIEHNACGTHPARTFNMTGNPDHFYNPVVCRCNTSLRVGYSICLTSSTSWGRGNTMSRKNEALLGAALPNWKTALSPFDANFGTWLTLLCSAQSHGVGKNVCMFHQIVRNGGCVLIYMYW